MVVVYERRVQRGCCIYEKKGLFLIWWGLSPAKSQKTSVRLVNRRKRQRVKCNVRKTRQRKKRMFVFVVVVLLHLVSRMQCNFKL